MARSGDYLPSSDAGLLAWSLNFSTLIVATPTAFGLTTSIAGVYSSKQITYKTALAASTNPATRGKATVYAKNTAKKDLIAYTRTVAAQVVTTMTVTNQQRLDLGLNIRKTPAPVPAPTTSPTIDFVSTTGRTVKFKMHDSATGRRSRPAGVSGASIFSFVGAAAPADISAWKFEGNTGKTTVEVSFPASVANGATVWFTAFWFNPRKQSGPACDPVNTNLPGGSVSMAA